MEAWRAVDVPQLPGQGPDPKVAGAAGGLGPAAAGPDASIYACGITPYDATHIGHAATYIAWDLLIRAWRDAGHRVSYVQNVTDVDDPLLERAERDGQDWRELADLQIALFRSDMEALRVLPPGHYVGAVEALPVIERFAQVLADHGVLYELEGDQYFARTADSSFGTVAGLDTATMITLFGENGGDPGRPGKKDPLDALVWLAARPGEPAWPSGFGCGRPGWHVECAAIATEYLGVTFDVQAGGSDLTFPHHEMSASHARAAYGGPAGPDGPVFARRYLHSGMVRLGGEKMSKSRGNLVFVSGLLAGGADPMAVRLAILAHHYHEDWDWDDAGLTQATARLELWRAALCAQGQPAASAKPSPPGQPGADVLTAVRERLADDLDTPGALAVVDAWADATLADAGSPHSGLVRDTLVRDTVARDTVVRDTVAGDTVAVDTLVRDTVDALLGIAL